MRHASILLGVLLAGLAAPAYAINPRVTLRLRDVTPAEAGAALGRAAGFSIRESGESSRAAPPADGDIRKAERSEVPSPRLSFDWNDVPFATALRELCQKADLRPMRAAARAFVLFPGGIPARKPVGLFEQDGVRLYVTGVRVQDSRELDFGDDPGFPFRRPDQNGLQLNVQAEGSISAEQVVGFRAVSARDDRGNLLVSEGSERRYAYAGSPSGHGAFPDTWTGSVALSVPHPAARKLTWVEGELWGYRRGTVRKLELPWPAAGEIATHPLEQATLMLNQGSMGLSRRSGLGAEASGAFARSGAAQEAPGTFWVGVRTAVRANGREKYTWSLCAPIGVVGVSGKFYTGLRSVGNSSATTSGYSEEARTWKIEDVNEPISRVVWEYEEFGKPERLFSFRLSDVPLPLSGGLRTAPAAPKRDPDPDFGEPDEDQGAAPKGRGILASSVTIGGAPAPGGIQMIGVARREGRGWGSTRWSELQMGADGAAKLTNLLPGHYRVLRVYRLPTPATVRRPGLRAPSAPAAPKLGGSPPIEPAADGSWSNSEVEVDVVADKVVGLPPLKWTPKAGPAR